tara:strand:+ start:326 stop:1345 length:1020 start_codon:yes stop_codon:yes gene_type:complete
MSNQPPIGVPQGAIRFNTDSQKLEFFAQDRWYEMATDVPTLDGGARGLFTSGYNHPAYRNVVDMITIPTAGNATDFADMISGIAPYGAAGGASRTRGMIAGGSISGNGSLDVIQYITIAQQADFVDFGDLTKGRRGNGGMSNQTRFVIAGGYSDPDSSQVNNIDFVTIASLGDAVDFGDTSQNVNNTGGTQSPTRGVFSNGGAPSGVNTMEFITIASTGNSEDFGDSSRTSAESFGCGNSTRGIFFHGVFPSPEAKQNVIDFITIATKGNATNFGDNTYLVQHGMALSDSTRAVCAGGVTVNHMSYINIATGGDAIDFGDLSVARWSGNGGISNAHGGL